MHDLQILSASIISLDKLSTVELVDEVELTVAEDGVEEELVEHEGEADGEEAGHH